MFDGIICPGGVSEWFKVPLSKSGAAVTVAVGSNPTSSATLGRRIFGFWWVGEFSASEDTRLCITIFDKLYYRYIISRRSPIQVFRVSRVFR